MPWQRPRPSTRPCRARTSRRASWPTLASQILATDARISDLESRIATTFRAHPQAEITESLPGMGPILGAELIAAAGDLNGYANAGRLAPAAGLVPVPRDSGRRTGNMHRPMRYSRKLRRVFYLSAQASMMREGPNRDFYLKKRGEGCADRVRRPRRACALPECPQRASIRAEAWSDLPP